MCWVIYPCQWEHLHGDFHPAAESANDGGGRPPQYPVCTGAARSARAEAAASVLQHGTAVGTTTFATDESLIPPKCPPIFAKGNTKCRYDTTSTLAATYTMYWEYNNNSHYVEIKKTQFGLLVVNQSYL